MIDAHLIQALDGAAEELRLAHDARVKEKRRADEAEERLRELRPTRRRKGHPECSGAECAGRKVKGQPAASRGGLCVWCWLGAEREREPA